MAQPPSRLPRRTPPQPFSQGQYPTGSSGLFWARLMTYRPLFLLGGLWAVLVGLSAIAYQGLMFNEPVEVYQEAPLTLVPAIPSADTPETEDLAAAVPQSGTVALWGLLSLVGLCGFGCFVLTQQIKASARPRRRPKPATRPRPVAKAPQPQGPKRLAPYLPQRDGVVVPGVRIVEAPVFEASSAAPSPVPPDPKAPQQPFDPSALAPQPTPMADVPALQGHHPDSVTRPGTLSPTTLVPDGADLSLDYPEGSVAHALDLRQRRSLSSFM